MDGLKTQKTFAKPILNPALACEQRTPIYQPQNGFEKTGDLASDAALPILIKVFPQPCI